MWYFLWLFRRRRCCYCRCSYFQWLLLACPKEKIAGMEIYILVNNCLSMHKKTLTMAGRAYSHCKFLRSNRQFHAYCRPVFGTAGQCVLYPWFIFFFSFFIFDWKRMYLQTFVWFCYFLLYVITSHMVRVRYIVNDEFRQFFRAYLL